MNVLLVYPKYPDTFWSFKHVLWFVAKKAAFPPLGLLTVGAMLPEKWHKKLVDMNVAPLEDKDLEWADMVFVSAMIVQEDSAREIIARCRQLGRTIVAGGPLFTTRHEEFEGVDHFVLNEAESTLPPFLKDLENGRPERVYLSEERPDITRTPVPMWSLLNMKQYVTMAVQYSRGCPFNCEFCDIVIMNGRVPRTKNPEQLVAELQALYEAKWRGSVFIVDDNFIGNKVKVKDMLPHITRWQKERGYPFSFLTEASTNLADDETLMELMSAANFFKVFLGLETPNVDSLVECGKYQNTPGDLADAVKRIHAHGMQVMGGFIVGFDHDTPSIFETQIRFIQQVGVVTAMIGLLTALPRTRLWHRLKDENRLLGESHGENTDVHVNFIPRMGKDTLVEGYRKLLATVYSRKYYYQRIQTFLKDYRPTVKTRLSWTDIKAFTRSLWRIGLLSRARFQYWKLLIRTSLTRIRSLPIAVELAIIGLHFEKVNRRIQRKTPN